MGLFDLIGDEQKPRPKIRGLTGSIVKQTDNVPATLKEIARDHSTRPETIDFVIHSTLSEIKLPGSEGWEEITPSIMGKLNDKAFLLEPELLFRQVHHLTFRPRPKTMEFELSVELKADRHRSRAAAVIKPDSKVREFSNLREFIEDELNKIKLRYGMLIGLREGSMRTDITHLSNKIRVHNKVPEPITVRLCDWLAPIEPIDDRLILHYKENAKRKEAEAAEKSGQTARKPDRVDYADRGFVQAVEEGDLLAEYIKPKDGRAGRDFRGNFLPMREARLQYGPVDFPDAETIRTEEDEGSIRYFAKRRGYVALQDGHLSVGDTLEVDSLDFKHTGNITAGLDKDVKIAVRGKDANEDHIGPNTKVEVTELDLTGSVANGAVVKAVRLSIEGQTHSTSRISATESARIAVHRGWLETRHAEIDRLEHGRVSADEVVVDRVMGGTIAARRITVGTLHSHANLIASEQIVIKQLAGGENRLYIEAAAAKGDKAEYKALIEENKELKAKHEEVDRKYRAKHAMIKRNKPQADDLKSRIDADRKAGRTPPSAFIERYRNFLEELKNAKYLHAQLKETEEALGANEDRITLLQDGILKAAIINKDIWRNYNEIRFRTINPPKEILYVPPENAKLTQIKLELSGHDDYAIRAFE